MHSDCCVGYNTRRCGPFWLRLAKPRNSIGPEEGKRWSIRATTKRWRLCRATLEEAQVEAIIERARNVLESLGAKVHTARVWDKRKLAYEIKKHKEGVYLLFRYEGQPKAAEELNRILKINEDVIRFRTFRLEPEEFAKSS
jgi:small subunit ribosomal protein S6